MNAALGVRFLAGAVFLAVAFLAGAAFFAAAALGAAFFATAFLAGAFFAAAFLAGAFFAVAMSNLSIRVGDVPGPGEARMCARYSRTSSDANGTACARGREAVFPLK